MNYSEDLTQFQHAEVYDFYELLFKNKSFITKFAKIEKKYNTGKNIKTFPYLVNNLCQENDVDEENMLSINMKIKLSQIPANALNDVGSPLRNYYDINSDNTAYHRSDYNQNNNTEKLANSNIEYFNSKQSLQSNDIKRINCYTTKHMFPNDHNHKDSQHDGFIDNNLYGIMNNPEDRPEHAVQFSQLSDSNTTPHKKEDQSNLLLSPNSTYLHEFDFSLSQKSKLMPLSLDSAEKSTSLTLLQDFEPDNLESLNFPIIKSKKYKFAKKTKKLSEKRASLCSIVPYQFNANSFLFFSFLFINNVKIPITENRIEFVVKLYENFLFSKKFSDLSYGIKFLKRDFDMNIDINEVNNLIISSQFTTKPFLQFLKKIRKLFFLKNINFLNKKFANPTETKDPKTIKIDYGETKILKVYISLIEEIIDQFYDVIGAKKEMIIQVFIWFYKNEKKTSFFKNFTIFDFLGLLNFYLFEEKTKLEEIFKMLKQNECFSSALQEKKMNLLFVYKVYFLFYLRNIKILKNMKKIEIPKKKITLFSPISDRIIHRNNNQTYKSARKLMFEDD